MAENRFSTFTVALSTFLMMTWVVYLREGGYQSHEGYVPIPRSNFRRKFAARTTSIQSVINNSFALSINNTNGAVSSISRDVGYFKSNEEDPTSQRNQNTNSVSSSSYNKKNYKRPPLTCVKQIQLWAQFSFEFPQKEYECPEIDCKARYIHSNSYQKLATSHAVILHHLGNWRWKDLARNRPDHQMWIYMTKESPLHAKKMSTPNPLMYNWSMTYSTESDFVIPYGRYLQDVSEVPQNDDRNWAAGKTRLITWMASNCGSTSWSRKKFVKKLQQFVQVDTYGACGDRKCPRRSAKCDLVLSSHKFYLALENSECRDYITEKFWDKALNHHMVPIVYGAPRKDYEKVAPPHSFIHLSDFPNVTALVDYVNYLDRNDTAYNQYFEWRKTGSVENYVKSQAHSAEELFCGIAKKLKELDTSVTRAQGKLQQANLVDIKTWWKSSCHHLKSPWSD